MIYTWQKSLEKFKNTKFLNISNNLKFYENMTSDEKLYSMLASPENMCVGETCSDKRRPFVHLLFGN